jgi:hypothetical protein
MPRQGFHARWRDRLAHMVPTAGPVKRLPPDVWQRMDRAAQVEHLAGLTLDDCLRILELPMELAVESTCVMNGKVQVIRVLMHAISKVGLERHRLEQQEALGRLIDDFAEDEGSRAEYVRVQREKDANGRDDDEW